MTVRRAVNILLQQGLVSTTQGRGTFVKSIELSTVKFGLDALQIIFAQNKVKLLEVRIVKADAGTAVKLEIMPGDRMIHIRRLIIKDDEPILYHHEYLIYDPMRPIVEAEMEVTALHGLFSGSGETSLKRGELAIKATILNDLEARMLLTQPALPAFRLEHIFYDFDNRPVSWGYLLCRGDRLDFKTTVGLSDKSEIQTGHAGENHENA